MLAIGHRLLKYPLRSNFKCFAFQTHNILRRHVSRKSLIMATHGEPMQVLDLVEDQIGVLNSEDILLKVLMAPINPSDINTIQGKTTVSLVEVVFPLIFGTFILCRKISHVAQTSWNSW